MVKKVSESPGYKIVGIKSLHVDGLNVVYMEDRNGGTNTLSFENGNPFLQECRRILSDPEENNKYQIRIKKYKR